MGCQQDDGRVFGGRLVNGVYIWLMDANGLGT